MHEWKAVTASVAIVTGPTMDSQNELLSSLAVLWRTVGLRDELSYERDDYTPGDAASNTDVDTSALHLK